MAVERTYLGSLTSTVYNPKLPSNSATWDRFIYNDAATPTAFGLGLGTAYNLFGAKITTPAVQRSQAAVYAPKTIDIGSTGQTGAAARGSSCPAPPVRR